MIRDSGLGTRDSGGRGLGVRDSAGGRTMRRRTWGTAVLAVFVGLGTVVPAAQAPQEGQPGPGPGRGAPGGRGGPAAGQTVETIRPLKPNLYMITGGGANTLVRVTP